MDRLKLLFLFFFLSSAVIGRSASAAGPAVHLIGPAGIIRNGETFSVEVRLSSDGRLVNAADLHLKFSPQYFQVTDVQRQENVWPLWPELPKWDNQAGTVSLVAGRPHGLIALEAPVAIITFKSAATGLTTLVLDQPRSAIYLNDGQGTSVPIPGQALEIGITDSLLEGVTLSPSTTPAPEQWAAQHDIHIVWPTSPQTSYSFILSQDSQTVPTDAEILKNGSIDYRNLADGIWYWSIHSRVDGSEWTRLRQYRFLLDTEAPQLFNLSLLPASSTYGKTQLVWQTQDATSGVLYADITVGKRVLNDHTSPVAISPLWAGKDVTVVVYDRAGNKATAHIRLPGNQNSLLFVVLISCIVGLTVLGIILYLHYRKKRRR